jgi:hypothetical protein
VCFEVRTWLDPDGDAAADGRSGPTSHSDDESVQSMDTGSDEIGEGHPGDDGESLASTVSWVVPLVGGQPEPEASPHVDVVDVNNDDNDDDDDFEDV